MFFIKSSDIQPLYAQHKDHITTTFLGTIPQLQRMEVLIGNLEYRRWHARFIHRMR